METAYALYVSVGNAALWLNSPALVSAIGFSSVGPVAGSVAATVQSTMGGTVAAGSMFAGLQSLAMGGAAAGAGAILGTVAVGAVGVAAVCALRG
ncbi:hypothetical protein HDU93_008676 [Gonapodya sp. JEL0774]|nr:hypothetical protein HDU93_008676 [Gonapodya sp. JEL0774]